MNVVFHSSPGQMRTWLYLDFKLNLRGIEQTRRATDVEAELARLERGERVEFAKIHPILRVLSTG